MSMPTPHIQQYLSDFNVQFRTSMETDYLKSADDIVVNISDRKTPIAMLMGPAAVGKTMTSAVSRVI